MKNLKDIALTDDGDIILNAGDVALVKGVDHAAQSINFRLKTNLNELFMHQDIGNKLIEIVGLPNTRETAEVGKRYIIDAITTRNFISEDEIEVNAIPISANTVVYTIQITPDGYQAVTMVLEVDLKNGIRRVT